MWVVADAWVKYCLLWDRFKIKPPLASPPCPVSLPYSQNKAGTRVVCEMVAAENSAQTNTFVLLILVSAQCKGHCSRPWYHRTSVPCARLLFLPAIFSHHRVRPKQRVPRALRLKPDVPSMGAFCKAKCIFPFQQELFTFGSGNSRTSAGKQMSAPLCSGVCLLPPFIFLSRQLVSPHPFSVAVLPLSFIKMSLCFLFF